MQRVSIDIPDNKFVEFLELAKKMGLVINVEDNLSDDNLETQQRMVATALKSEEDIKNGRVMTPEEAKERLRVRFLKSKSL